METGLSSNATPVLPGLRNVMASFSLSGLALVMAMPLAAQDDTAATAPAAETPPPPAPSPRPRINVLVTVPRGEVNQAQVLECEDRADAGTISGEIVVCRQIGDDGSNSFSGSRAAAQKRYAEETAFKDIPQTPDVAGPGIFRGPASIGALCLPGLQKCPPPPAIMVDFKQLPKAPPGSDADRIARGLPPLGQNGELTEEEEKARREAAGIRTAVPPRGKK